MPKDVKDFEKLLMEIRQRWIGKEVECVEFSLDAQDAERLEDAVKQNTNIIRLSLPSNNLADEGAAKFEHNTTLVWLDLEDNHIGDDGAISLSRNHSLRYLYLGYNKFTERGIHALTSNCHLSLLDLSGNELAPVCLTMLAENTTLTSLLLSHQIKIRLDVLNQFARNASLSVLDLSSSNIDNSGAALFSSNNTLTSLNLSNNKITRDGALALSCNTTLTDLSLQGNDIGREGSVAIEKMLLRNQRNMLLFLKACHKGGMTAVQQLLEDGLVSPYCRGRYNKSKSMFSGLELAIRGHHTELVSWLVSRYTALKKMQQYPYKTALEVARECNFSDIRMILERDNIMVGSDDIRQKDSSRQINYLLELQRAQGNDPVAACLVGQYHLQKGDTHNAAIWLRKSIELGNQEAKLNLAEILFNRGGDANILASAELLMDIAENYPAIKDKLKMGGIVYKKLITVAKHCEDSSSYPQQVFVAEARSLLAIIHADDTYLSKDIEKAKYCYRRAIAVASEEDCAYILKMKHLFRRLNLIITEESQEARSEPSSLSPAARRLFSGLFNKDLTLERFEQTVQAVSDINRQNQGKRGDTALMFLLSKEGNLEERLPRLSVLLNHGALWSAQNKQGETAEELLRKKHPNFVTRFLR